MPQRRCCRTTRLVMTLRLSLPWIVRISVQRGEVWLINLKSARNSGSNAPPSFIDDLLDVSDRSMMPMVVQKEHLIEPHAGDDKGAGARQAFGGADFEVTGLDEALEEQLDSFAAIGIQVPL